MNAPSPSFVFQPLSGSLLEHLVIQCGIQESLRIGAQPLVRGLSATEFARMCVICLPECQLENGVEADVVLDEFDELLELLLLHAEPADEMAHWLAATLATAAQRDNHLWQDMGLPSRRELSAILNQRFPRLAAANVGDMKWKKFFYRQLCQQAGVMICKSPKCSDCTDYAVCFGPES
jgi:nitrogen fixation protein NifQ